MLKRSDEGSCTSLEACQKFWFANSNNEPQQTTLACQLWDDGPDSPSSYLSQQCSDGYEEPLCSMWSANHGVSGHFMCAYCPQHATVAFEYFLLLVATILRLINAFLIWRLLNESLNFRGQQAEGSDYVEALLVHVQLTSLLGLLDIRWPSILGGLSKAFAWITHINPQSAAFDCILPHSNHGVPLSVARTLVHLAIPFIILAAFCTAWILAYACLQHYHPLLIRGHVHGWLQRRLKVTCYSVLGYFYPSLTQATLSDLQCLPATQLITPYLLAHCTSPF